VQRNLKTTFLIASIQDCSKNTLQALHHLMEVFEDTTAEEGLKHVVLLLANKELLDNNMPSSSKDGDTADSISHCMRPPTKPTLRHNPRLELAIVRLTSVQQKPTFIRKTVADLFNRTARTKSSSPSS
jgi:hypothetical protein